MKKYYAIATILLMTGTSAYAAAPGGIAKAVSACCAALAACCEAGMSCC